MFHNLENRMEKIQEAINTINTFNKDLEEIRNKQTETKQLLKLKFF